MIKKLVLLFLILFGAKISFSQIDIFPDTLSTCNDPHFYLDAGLQFSDSSTSYLWSTGDTSSQISTTLPGLYSVVVTISSNGNKYIDTVTLINQDPPVIRFDKLVDSVCVNCGEPPIFLFPNLPADYTFTWMLNGHTYNYPILEIDPPWIGPGLHPITLYVEDYYGCKDTASHWLLGYIIGSIKELKGYELSVSPNPVNGQFLFRLDGKAPLGEVNVLLTDQKGVTHQLMNHIDRSGRWKTSLDVSSFPAGIYVLLLESQKGIISKKLIIQ